MRLKNVLFLCLFTLSATTAGIAQTARPAATAGKKPAAMRTIDIIGSDEMKYSVTTITARPGEQIRIRLIARGVIPKIAMAHNFVLLKPATDIVKLLTAGAPHRESDFIPPAMMDAVLAKTGFAGPGETVQVVFTVPAKPGSYPYICTFAGHYQAGMKGTLVVK